MADTDVHVASAKTKLDDAVLGLNDELKIFLAKKRATIPRLDAQGIATQLNSIPANSDPSDLVEKLVMLDISKADTDDTTKPDTLVRRASQFAGQLVPLTSVALGFVGHVLDGSGMAMPITAVANGTRLLLDLAAKEKERKVQFLAELDRISYQARRVREIQKHPDSIINPLMREKCLNLLTAIINFLRGSLKYLGQNIFKQISKSIFMGAEIWQSSINDLKTAYEEYDQALLLQIASTVITQSQQVVAQPNTEDDEFKRWLAPSASESEAKFVANLVQRADGTLRWVLELPEFKDWRTGDASAAAKTLWMTGAPGTGKSTISAYLYDLLIPQYPDDIVLSFFCKRGTLGLTSAFDMVRTLCYQLVSKSQFYRKYLQPKPDLPKSRDKDNLIYMFNTLIKDPIRAAPNDRSILIFLDGLDELQDSVASGKVSGQGSYNTKTEIEILLEQLVVLPQVKVLVTSRQVPALNTILSKSGTVRHITGADNAADIEKYVAHRIKDSPKLQSGFSEIKIDPLEYFTSKANGVFLWVTVVLDVLERANSTDNFKQALDQVHPTMNDIYDDIFARAEQRQTLGLMLEVLRWMLILPEPFTVRQMGTATTISLGTKVIDMEEFLRTECGGLLDLVPILGSKMDQDTSLEIHIGHETFQAWLEEKLGLETRRIAHGNAAKTCLRYLVDRVRDESFEAHAVARWPWHLRLSMGIKEPPSAEPRTALEGGTALFGVDAVEIFALLYKFLSTFAVDKWVDYHMRRTSYTLELFWEVHYTCNEIIAWCRTNKEHIHDKDIDNAKLEGVTPSQLKEWRDSLDDPRVIAWMLWPSICRGFLWNISDDWRHCTLIVDSITHLFIYTFDQRLAEMTPQATALLKKEAEFVEENATHPDWRRWGKLRGNLDIHVANTIVLQGADGATKECCDAVIEAGGFDEMSGVCNGNLSIFLYKMARKVTSDQSQILLEEAKTRVQDAIDEDPMGSPRNYYHLARLHEACLPPESELALEAYRAAVERDPSNKTDARTEVYQAEETKLLEQDPPDYDAAVNLLEEAIARDPTSSGNRWFHHLVDVHKKRGDIAAARDVYRRLIAFDPIWSTYWDQSVDMLIDENEYRENRRFDWRSWSDALIEVIREDPSSASTYWYKWCRKATELSEYQHYDIALEILTYGAETASTRTDTASQAAYGNFLEQLGKTFCMMGDWDAAISPLEEAVPRVKAWKWAEALKCLTYAHMALERWDEARAAVSQMLTPNEYAIEHVAQALLGEIYLLEGKPTEAIREYKGAIRGCEKSDAYNDKSGDLGLYYVDLGLVYEKLGRASQAVAMFQKALPHLEEQTRKAIEFREIQESLWRTEGRWHAKLGWLLERLDSSDPRALEQYELAAWAFDRTVYAEDDFVEITEGKEAHADIDRVKRGEKWSDGGDAAVRNTRMRRRISSLRTNWGNGKYKRDVQKERKRGRA